MTANNKLQELRRRASSDSLLAFARLYMLDRVQLPWSDLHREIDGVLLSAIDECSSRVAVGAPDGYGKTTLGAIVWPLWAMAMNRAKHIAIVRPTIRDASRHVALLQNEIIRLHLLRSDFPALKPRGNVRSKRLTRCRELHLRGGGIVSAHSTRCALRASAFAGPPPDLVIIDECEPTPTELLDPWTASDAHANRFERWFGREVLDGLPDALITILGSRSVGMSVIDQALEYCGSPGWTTIAAKAVTRYPDEFERWFEWAAIHGQWKTYMGKCGPNAAKLFLEGHRDRLLAGAEVLWPERESFESMMRERFARGWAWFDAVKQGRPPAARSCGAGGRDTSIWIGSEKRLPITDDAGYGRQSPVEARIRVTLGMHRSVPEYRELPDHGRAHWARDIFPRPDEANPRIALSQSDWF